MGPPFIFAVFFVAVNYLFFARQAPFIIISNKQRSPLDSGPQHQYLVLFKT